MIVVRWGGRVGLDVIAHVGLGVLARLWMDDGSSVRGGVVGSFGVGLRVGSWK